MRIWQLIRKPLAYGVMGAFVLSVAAFIVVVLLFAPWAAKLAVILPFFLVTVLIWAIEVITGS
jgi:hypothetical protein